MNKITISGVVANRSATKFAEISGKQEKICTFELHAEDGLNVKVLCVGLLALSHFSKFTDGDKVSIIGKLGTVDNEVGIIASVIIVNDNTVYPDTYPADLAIAEKEKIEKQEEISRIAAENFDPERDPF